MYIITGGAGFIGSCLLKELNSQGIDEILVVDNLGKSEKWKNLVGKSFKSYIHKKDFLEMIKKDKNHFGKIKGVVHLGACSSTTCTDIEYLMTNNFLYSQYICKWSILQGVRFVYASSAATYGDGKNGFSDSSIRNLRPINGYGFSKHLFDLWSYSNNLFDKIVGLKFFNVFGPNEYHKGEMRSLVHKAFGQIKSTGKIKLFRSHRKDYKDGMQKRDFVYVKDCTKIITKILFNNNINGIFNLGSGVANSWNALAKAIFSSMQKQVNIEYINMPQNLIDSYQYYTQADMKKLESTKIKISFTPVQLAIDDYIKNYLNSPKGIFL